MPDQVKLRGYVPHRAAAAIDGGIDNGPVIGSNFWRWNLRNKGKSGRS